MTSDKLMLERKLKEEGFLLKQIEKEKIDLENKLEAEQVGAETKCIECCEAQLWNRNID